MRVFCQNNPSPSSALIAECQRTYNLSDRDNVTVFILPKGQSGKRRGRFLFRNMSAKANQLQAEVSRIKGKIENIETSSIPDKDKMKKIAQLRGMLEYTSYKLKAEVASLPLSGYIVDEESE